MSVPKDSRQDIGLVVVFGRGAARGVRRCALRRAPRVKSTPINGEKKILKRESAHRVEARSRAHLH